MGFGGLLTYAWTDNSGISIAKANDHAVLLAYCSDLKQTIYTTAGGRRDILTGDPDVSPFTGHEVQTYIAFITKTCKNNSNSPYTGSYLVS